MRVKEAQEFNQLSTVENKIKLTQARFVYPIMHDGRMVTVLSSEAKSRDAADLVFDSDTGLLHLRSRKTKKVRIVPSQNVCEMTPLAE
jgi:hypothetical protein